MGLVGARGFEPPTTRSRTVNRRSLEISLDPQGESFQLLRRSLDPQRNHRSPQNRDRKGTARRAPDGGLTPGGIGRVKGGVSRRQ